MANTSKGRFPSYGLVRGPSHADGGVPASVANGPDVELEGGEYIIPKEAVPDYLPVLQQITQVGRDRQQMQNGNTAIDALIASASMQNGIAQPKSPVYQEGGRISNFFKKQRENFQRAAMMGEKTGTRNPFLKTAEEQLALQARDTSPLSIRRESPNISLGELEEVALVQPYRPEVMSAPEQVDMLPDEALEEIQMSQDTFEPFGRIPNMPEDERGNFLNYLFGGRDNLITTRSLLEDILGLRTNKAQGGMVQYEDGGEVHSRRMYNQGTGFDKKKSDLDGDGKISEYERKRGMAIAKAMGKMQMGGMVGMQRPMNPAMNFSPMQRMNPRMYQEGGQVQPRKQQEMRNPNVYFGPPDSLAYSVKDLEKQAQENFESFMDSLEYRRSLNPFTGEPMDTDADVKRLLERMKKSKIPPSRQRMPMQEGGQVKASDMGLQNFGEVTSMPSGSVSRPEFEAFMNYAATEEEAAEMEREQMANFMSLLENEKRVRPVKPDTYNTTISEEDGMMIMSQRKVPKLSEAYMSAFGFATPLSQRQGALLQRKMIAPETLNPSVKGLINRVLVQRLGNENN